MEYFDQPAWNAAAQLVIALLQLVVAILFPVFGWIFARRAFFRVRCVARCEMFRSPHGARFWSISIRAKKSFCKDVGILVSLGRENNRIQKVFLSENGSHAEIQQIGSNIFVSSDLLPKSEVVRFGVKLAADDIPRIRSTHGGISIENEISARVFSENQATLTAYQRAMILMLLFVLYYSLVVVRLIYLNFSS